MHLHLTCSLVRIKEAAKVLREGAIRDRISLSKHSNRGASISKTTTNRLIYRILVDMLSLTGPRVVGDLLLRIHRIL
jgi:hypothetical protein